MALFYTAFSLKIPANSSLTETEYLGQVMQAAVQGQRGALSGKAKALNSQNHFPIDRWWAFFHVHFHGMPMGVKFSYNDL